MTAPLFESTITSLPLLNKGKVRDIYAVDADKLLIVTTDRLSAFDVILPDPIPRKGEVLQAVANFWFEKLGHIVPNQLTGIDPETVVAENERDQVRGRDRFAGLVTLALLGRAEELVPLVPGHCGLPFFCFFFDFAGAGVGVAGS